MIGARFLAIALLTTVASPIPAQTSRATVWLTGRALDRRLDETAGVRWQGVGLRAALTDLGRTQRVCVLVDRRIDPSMPLDLETTGTLRAVLEQAAAARGAALCVVQGVAYIAPPSTVAALPAARRALRESVAAMPREPRGTLTATRRWQWGDLTTPRELLVQLERESGWTFTALESIPHDLWAGAELPALSWLDRALLVVAQFDQTLELDADARQARLVALPLDPQAQPQPRAPTAKRGAGKQTATLSVREAPLRDVLRSLAAQFALQLEIDERVTPDVLAAPVTFAAEGLELQPLLAQLLQDRARFELRGGTLRILPTRSAATPGE